VALSTDKQLPVLAQEETEEVWHYAYANDDDLVGKIEPREKR
jgi:hypothetical protein